MDDREVQGSNDERSGDWRAIDMWEIGRSL